MIAQIFAAIELILKLIGLWNGFLDYTDKKRIADAEANKQEREKAVDDQKDAKDEAQFDKDQSTVINHQP